MAAKSAAQIEEMDNKSGTMINKVADK